MVDGSPSVCLRECTQVCGSAYHTCYPPWWRDQYLAHIVIHNTGYTLLTLSRSTTPCPTELYRLYSYTAKQTYTLYIAIHPPSGVRIPRNHRPTGAGPPTSVLRPWRHDSCRSETESTSPRLRCGGLPQAFTIQARCRQSSEMRHGTTQTSRPMQ